MTMEITKQATTALGKIKAYMNNETIKQRFTDMLGKHAAAFNNSLINVIRNSSTLQNCTPDSIMSAAIIPATLNLSIEPTFGQAYIIGYKNTATFQIGYKGIIQLCIRSGKYQVIHCSEIYKDELKGHNPITGQVEFNDPSTFKMRYSSKNGNNVVGHYAYFKLTTGFEKAKYMTKEEVMAHAEKFSQAYQYDLREKKKSSPWSTNPIAMGNKTVLKLLLSKFGIMSVEIQDAISKDDSYEATQDAMSKRIEAEQGSEPIDADFEDPAPQDEPQSPAEETAKPKRGRKPKNKKPEYLYHCNSCGHDFDEPKISGTGANQVSICPKCLTKDISATEDKDPAWAKDEAAAQTTTA